MPSNAARKNAISPWKVRKAAVADAGDDCRRKVLQDLPLLTERQEIEVGSSEMTTLFVGRRLGFHWGRVNPNRFPRTAPFRASFPFSSEFARGQIADCCRTSAHGEEIADTYMAVQFF